MKFQQLCVAIALASCATASMAKPIWQDFSLTALYGENYELTPEDEQTTVTAEYAAKLKYGDFLVLLTVQKAVVQRIAILKHLHV